jgi:fibronectin type 3 domain-containing protein
VPHSVLLNWTASPSATATGYNVYRSNVSGGGYIKVNSSTVGSLTYTDTTVQNSTIYYYVMTAVDALGDESPYSSEIQMNIP